jgi:zinc transporter ZupT
MSKLVGLSAAIILILVAILDVAKESREIIGLGPVLILLTFGVLMWALLSKLAHRQTGRDAGLPLNLALWSHSFFEGALAALSFSFSIRTGLIVGLALLVHLIPESFAVITTLKQTGFSTRYAVRVYAISLAILMASFSLLGFILPQSSETILTIMTTIVGGSFIYLAIRTIRRYRRAIAN